MKNIFNHHYLILFALMALGMPLIGHTQMAQWIQYLKPQTAPNVVWQNTRSETTSLKELNGKVVLINIWATWCTPCLVEMPTLDALQKRYKQAGLEVIAIAVDNPTLPAMLKFYRQANVQNLGMYKDFENSAILGLGPTKIPTTYVLNRQHKIIGRLEGADSWMKPAARHIIETLLKENMPKKQPLKPEAVMEVDL